MNKSEGLTAMSAVEVVRLLRAGEVTPDMLIDAALARIAEIDPDVNALPTLCPDRAREAARHLARATDEARLLAGLPLVIKDSMDVAGVRSTFGSTLYADRIPTRSDIQVETLERRGGIVLARSNSPEFAAGANTFNDVFGRTLNPWNTAMTCGGSSGGSAVAVATGMAWLANGSDLGGSLRIPASFCSVVGLRPSPGVVAHGPGPNCFDPLSVSGPLARSVADVALLLDAMAGQDRRDPLSLPAPATSFSAAVAAPRKPRRVAFSRDLGYLPVDAEVAAITEAAAQRFRALGVDVVEAELDLREADEAFQVLRAVRFVTAYGELLDKHRDRLKPEVVWNIEKGQRLSGESVARANRLRFALYQKMAAFFAEHDLLLAATVLVPPFPVEQRYVERVGDVRFSSYVDWLAMTYAITVTSCPALSLPCGFTREGLPVGLQMVGPPRGDAALLEAAALLETELGVVLTRPIEPRPPAKPATAAAG